MAFLISSYLLFDPADWLYDLMELTDMPIDFRLFLLVLAIGGYVCSYVAERYMFPGMARFIGKTKQRLRPQNAKKRKEYKVILESMRM